jgi:hypothetical protein
VGLRELPDEVAVDLEAAGECRQVRTGAVEDHSDELDGHLDELLPAIRG